MSLPSPNFETEFSVSYIGFDWVITMHDTDEVWRGKQKEWQTPEGDVSGRSCYIFIDAGGSPCRER